MQACETGSINKIESAGRNDLNEKEEVEKNNNSMKVTGK